MATVPAQPVRKAPVAIALPPQARRFPLPPLRIIPKATR